LYHVHNFGCESCIVGRVFEERIVLSIYLMVKNVGEEMGKAYGSSIGNEMYFMSLSSQP
jgi:hypothetical protein